MNSLIVGFISPSLQVNDQRGYLIVNPAPYYLHGYFRKYYPQYEHLVKWIPSVLTKEPIDQLIKYIKDNNINVLGASIDITNKDWTLKILEGIRQEFGSDLKIIIGGPSCNADKEPWETMYPYIDHFVVGQGEKAWSQLVLDWLGIKTLEYSSTNIVHFMNNKKKYEWEFIRDIHYSPYVVCEDLVIEIKKKYKDSILRWPYETQRGCPYRCSFCDWNGGQSNKVQKRKDVDFLADIDFFMKHEMFHIDISDANFGMWDVDVEITERLAKYQDQTGGKFFITFNLNKTVDDNYRKILKLIYRHGLGGKFVKLSAQDVDDEILRINQRLGNWKEMKEVGLDLYREFAGTPTFKQINVETIIGMPGQSVGSIISMLDEYYSNGFVPRCYTYIVLSNAPISIDPGYKESLNIKTGKRFPTLEQNTVFVGVDTINDLSSIEKNISLEQIISCSTFTESDLVKMYMITQTYRIMLHGNVLFYPTFPDNWHILKPIIDLIITSEEFQKLHKTRTYNFINHRIDAVESIRGKLMLGNTDLKLIISKKIDVIREMLLKTNVTENIWERLFKMWHAWRTDIQLTDLDHIL